MIDMFFLNGRDDGLSRSGSATLTLGGSPSELAWKSRFHAFLRGEERPSNMWVLLTLLVGLAHVLLLTWLFKPAETLTEAKPLVMEVSMVVIPAPKPQVAPPKPAPPPPPVAKQPTPPKKTLPKPPIKKIPSVVQKPADFAPEPAAEPVSAPSEPATTSSASNSPATSNTSTSAPSTSNSQPTFTEANYRANYAHNPKPYYPPIAKSRGWQGKVLLRVQVSADGTSDAVSVETSSGHEILDESAVEAVKKWRFIPAKRGETPVASSVIVPISFTLRD